MANKRKKKKKFPQIWEKIRWYVIGSITLVLLYNLSQGDYGFIKYWELTRQKKALSEKIVHTQKQIDSLKVVIDKLQNDLNYIEKVAREKYNMIKEGEIVFQFVPRKKKDNTEK